MGSPWKSVVGKMGNMKKSVDWIVCPVSNAEEQMVYIQSDKRIARINMTTGKAMLSSGRGGHPGFHALHPMLGAVEVDVPAEIMDQVRERRDAMTPDNGIGGVTLTNLMGNHD
jgi:hypothetical protein